MKNWTDDQFAAYLAAFTDGEGCIRLENGKYVNIYLANCHLGVLTEIRNRLGCGHIHSQQQKTHWSVRYRLKISLARDCRDFLNRVRPFLIIKAQIADKALARISEMEQVWVRRNERNGKIRTAVESGQIRKAVSRQYGVSPQRIAAIMRREVRTGL